MSHGVFVPNAVAAKNVDAWSRSAISASAVDNGNIVILSGLSSTAGEGEVWTAVVPSTSAGLTGVWVVTEPEIVKTGSYRGIDPDPRNFYNAIGDVFTVIKPQLGDIFLLTADNFSGSKGSSDVYGNATDTTGGLKLVWGASQTASVFSVKWLETTYISIGGGAIDTQRVTAYRVQVVGV